MHIKLMLVAIVVFASGCAFTPQTIKIEPKVDVKPSQIGAGRSVHLNVVDERAKKTLGTVGAGVGADISVEGDLARTVQRTIADGLSKMQFKTTDQRVANRPELRVEVRNLDYAITRGFWSGSLRVDAGLKGICVRDMARLYEKLHHGEYASGVQVVQGPEANSQYINTALSAAVNALLADQELMACLSK